MTRACGRPPGADRGTRVPVDGGTTGGGLVDDDDGATTPTGQPTTSPGTVRLRWSSHARNASVSLTTVVAIQDTTTASSARPNRPSNASGARSIGDTT